ncbi:MAG: hypothetical protein ACE5ER_09170 [Nitrospinaceae bacterium]
MITLQGEVTQTAAPPNQAGQFRTVTIWIQETEDEIQFTFPLSEFQSYQLKEGDKLSIKIDKQYDIDRLAQDLFRQGE